MDKAQSQPPVGACPAASSLVTGLEEVNDNLAALRLFLQGGINDEGKYREGLKQEHDRLMGQVAGLIEEGKGGRKTRWDLIMLGLSIIGAAIAGHYNTAK